MIAVNCFLVRALLKLHFLANGKAVDFGPAINFLTLVVYVQVHRLSCGMSFPGGDFQRCSLCDGVHGLAELRISLCARLK